MPSPEAAGGTAISLAVGADGRGASAPASQLPLANVKEIKEQHLPMEVSRGPQIASSLSSTISPSLTITHLLLSFTSVFRRPKRPTYGQQEQSAYLTNMERLGCQLKRKGTEETL